MTRKKRRALLCMLAVPLLALAPRSEESLPASAAEPAAMPEKYVADYKESYNRAANRLVREFSNSFCREDGSIDWEKLVEFNSGA